MCHESPVKNEKPEESQFHIVDPTLYLKLVDILKKRLPVSIQLYNTVTMQHTLRKNDQNSEATFEFYSYRGIMDDTAFIVGQESMKVKEEDEGVLCVFPSVPSPEFITTDIADDFVRKFCRERRQFTNLSYGLDRFCSPLIMQALLNKQFCLTVNSAKLYFWPERTRIENVEPIAAEPNIIVKPLDPNDGKIAAEYHNFGSWHKEEYYARKCIENNPSCGVYSKETGELMSWAVVYNFGSIGMFYTPEPFRGRGYGKLVIKNLIREMLKRGLIPATTALSRNDISDGLMKKSGFVETNEQDYVFTR